uniref:Uncharacterized protein n=1 Tax=Anguilla anguilla TaxID=7936 RepID=A0A0E9RQ41_ANGAN
MRVISLFTFIFQRFQSACLGISISLADAESVNFICIR